MVRLSWGLVVAVTFAMVGAADGRSQTAQSAA